MEVDDVMQTKAWTPLFERSNFYVWYFLCDFFTFGREVWFWNFRSGVWMFPRGNYNVAGIKGWGWDAWGEFSRPPTPKLLENNHHPTETQIQIQKQTQIKIKGWGWDAWGEFNRPPTPTSKLLWNNHHQTQIQTEIHIQTQIKTQTQIWIEIKGWGELSWPQNFPQLKPHQKRWPWNLFSRTHCKSAILPWRHYLKLSFLVSVFCPFVFLSGH